MGWEQLGTLKGPQGETGEKGDPGAGIPAGGTSGQVIVKNGEEDYAVTWGDAVSPLSPGVGVSIDDNVVNLKPATNEAIGGVKSGTGITIAEDGTISCSVESGIKFIGTYASDDQLPASSDKSGNVCLVGTQAPYKEYIWTGSAWELFGAFNNDFSLDGLATKEELDLKADKTQLENLATKDELATKADTSALADLATKAELELKADATALESKADVSALESKADKTELTNLATKEELGAKADATALAEKADKTEASTDAAGLMSAADKTKLDGVAAGANNYTLPAASVSAIGGVKVVSNEDFKAYMGIS